MTVILPEGFDWRNPDYVPIFHERARRLARLRQNPELLPGLMAFYRDNIPQFIVDWGCTTDPRNVADGLPTLVPFVLFPRQVEWVEWAVEHWRNSRPGVNPKSRESGVSWLAVATACSIGIFNEGVVVGFGSRKAAYVDEIGAPKSLFWKAREFLRTLPVEFRADYDPSDSAVMRIPIRGTGSVLTGEGGDNIGRGDRTSLYFVDEAAYLEHPDIAEASLSQTTRCRIDVSTANGLGNPFHRKVTTWKPEDVFTFHWRDDPRKDEDWYEEQKEQLDPVTIAQEIDIDFAASVEGVLIPQVWVQAAIGAHSKLFVSPNGIRSGALDVADEGPDLNAFCGGQGILVDRIEEWSGNGDDIFGTIQRAFGICEEGDYEEFRYDADGLGAGVRGDARVLNDQRRQNLLTEIRVVTFRGSGAVVHPERQDQKGRKNKDLFANLKAQCWWSLRERFRLTYRAVEEGAPFDPDEIISLDPAMPGLSDLCRELSQPTYSTNTVGKILVNKKPDGTRSPNKADSVMIRFASIPSVMAISDGVLHRAAMGATARAIATRSGARISNAVLARSRGRI